MTITFEDAKNLLGQLDADLTRDGRLGLPKRYMEGDHDRPYSPKGATAEFCELADKAVNNWIRKVPPVFARSLKLVGYRAAGETDNRIGWQWWQLNQMDAFQTVVHLGACVYGVAYARVRKGVLKGAPVPLITTPDPAQSAAWYSTNRDEWPIYALEVIGKDALTGARIWEIDDVQYTYTFRDGVTVKGVFIPGGMVGEPTPHGFTHVPWVRFRLTLAGPSLGMVTPLKADQDRINMVSFYILMALQYAAFRQRWATGLAVPVDEETGEPYETFNAAIERLWVSPDKDTKFGDFAQTDIQGHLAYLAACIKDLAGHADLNPNTLTGGDLSNISEGAMNSLMHSTYDVVKSLCLLFGEAWEQVFRLCAVAMGQVPDDEAEVRWEVNELTAFRETVEGLKVLVQDLQVPAQALWEKVPGVSEKELIAWIEMARKGDPFRILAGESDEDEPPADEVDEAA